MAVRDDRPGVDRHREPIVRVPGNARDLNRGDLPISRLAGGVGATASTFWRGDGTWAVPPSANPSKPYLHVKNVTTPIVPTQSIATKITFDTVVTDTDSYWDATNHRFTPGVSGRYQVYLNTKTRAAGNCVINGIIAMADIRKNGTTVQRSYIPLQLAKATGTIDTCVCALTEVQMNGSTDYIEGWGLCDDDNPAIFADGGTMWMEIHYLGP